MPITIKKNCNDPSKFSFERVAAYPDPTIAPKIIPIDKGITSDHSTLFFYDEKS